jgi:hypothetical protein
VELVRSQSDVPVSGTSEPENWRSFGFTRERKESSASNLSGSSLKENIKRMSAFWDSSPEEIAASLTKLEWECFIALRVWSRRVRLT